MRKWWANADAQGREMTPNTAGSPQCKTSILQTICTERKGCTYWLVWEIMPSAQGRLIKCWHFPTTSWILTTPTQKSVSRGPWHHLYIHTHWTAIHTDLLKASIGYGTTRKRPNHKSTQPLHRVHWNKQPGGPYSFHTKSINSYFKLCTKYNPLGPG